MGLSSSAAIDDEEEMKRVVASALAGHIKDVRSSDESTAGSNAGDVDDSSNSASSNPGPVSATALSESDHGFGNDWGLVGADGSDEGFGVIGLAVANEPAQQSLDSSVALSSATRRVDKTGSSHHRRVETRSTKASATVLSDHKLVDEAMRRGRGVDAGPNFSCSRRPHLSPTTAARVILVPLSLF